MVLRTLAFLMILISSSSVVYGAEPHAAYDKRLFDAAKAGDTQTIETLIKAGDKVDERDEHGWSPLYVAVGYNRTAAVKLLLKLGANPNLDIDGFSIILTAAGRDTEIVKALIEAGVNVNYSSPALGYSALDMAAGNDSKIFQALKARGVYYGQFPNTLETVKLLIAAGADVNHIDKTQQSPLRTAVRLNNFELAKLLIAAKADVNQRTDKLRGNENGDTILMEAITYASYYKDTRILKLLLEHGANPNERNESPYDNYKKDRGGFWIGETVLTYAVNHGLYQIAKILLQYHADPTLARTDGMTPIEIAKKHKNKTIIALLENAHQPQ